MRFHYAEHAFFVFSPLCPSLPPLSFAFYFLFVEFFLSVTVDMYPPLYCPHHISSHGSLGDGVEGTICMVGRSDLGDLWLELKHQDDVE